MTTQKIIVSALLVCIAVFGVAFFSARYLVSRLDGRGSVPAPQTLVPYSSEEGVSFMYPDVYVLSSHAGTAGDGDTLVLLPRGVTVPPNSDGPPAITLTVIRNATTPLEQWIRTDSRSNFALSPDHVLGSTAVGGQPAYLYRHSGLYEYDAFAVAHAGKIYVFEAGWNAPSDRIRLDFQNLVSSVQFTQ